MDFSGNKALKRHSSSFNSLKKLPVIKAQVVAYSIEEN
jgi:hypothetical protein